MLRFSALFLCTLVAASAETRLLRFPDIHGDRVVFTYAGDLWTVGAAGGTAVRLTAHPGLEMFAKFSPDGKWVAFTGQYDGDEQVYVIPASGGTPRQLTYYPARGPLPARWGYDNLVYGWTPDGKSVVFRSLRDGWASSMGRLYTVPVEGGMPKPMDIPNSGFGDLSPDGKKIVYSPLFRDFRTWKRYQGGWQQDLYILDLATHQVEPVSPSPRTERDPMWIGSKIYFASDRSGTLNLYEFDPATKRTRQLTHSTEWDVRWPSRGDNGEIIYEMDGQLYTLDTRSASAKPRKLSIDVPTDGVASRPSLIDVGGQVESYGLSPKGERALFVARGDVFNAPVEKGSARNLTRSSDAHDKEAEWSPDGRYIAFISDRTGEEELYLVSQDGSGKIEQLTTGGKAMRYHIVWAPDGKRLAFSDKDGKLYVLKLEDKSVIEIADEPRGRLQDYTWSPDSAWIAYSMTGAEEIRSIYIYNVAQNQTHRIDSGIFDEGNPVWDPDGDYLYFLSVRDYAPQLSNIEWNYAGARNGGIFALALRKDVKNPFPPQEDIITIDTNSASDARTTAGADVAKTEDTKPEEKKPGAKAVQIDFDGLASRVVRVPVSPDNYLSLYALKGHLLYVRTGNQYYGRDSDGPAALAIYSIKDRKETVLADSIRGYAVSGDGKKLLVREGSAFSIMDASPGGRVGKKSVSTAGLMYNRVPSQEWTQIFNEVWRRYRDFFYVKNMHGYDWEKLRVKYAPLLEYVGHRSDLNYIIGEMIAELNIGHAYITGGDWAIPPRPRVALPGARFELDQAAGRYRISKIFQGQNQEPVYRSPLTEIGVNASVGDYVLAIDGEDLPATENPYRLLRGKADRPVRLTLNSKPVAEGAREVTFQPVDSESDLMFLEMVERNRQYVLKATGGRVGYIYIPDMGAPGIREFIKYYYGQLRKQGLIIDVRGNGGGNVSSMLIERLRRELLATRFSRTDDTAGTYPQTMFHGHMVCLLNETSASDGDIFPAMFKRAGLGPLIGKRSWGGVTGITNRGTLIDGGQVNVPEFGFASSDGQWIIEGHGVDPDIVVENDPASVMAGRDPQLDRGIKEVLAAIEKSPKLLPSRPADPVKTK